MTQLEMGPPNEAETNVLVTIAAIKMVQALIKVRDSRKINAKDKVSHEATADTNKPIEEAAAVAADKDNDKTDTTASEVVVLNNLLPKFQIGASKGWCLIVHTHFFFPISFP